MRFLNEKINYVNYMESNIVKDLNGPHFLSISNCSSMLIFSHKYF